MKHRGFETSKELIEDVEAIYKVSEKDIKKLIDNVCYTMRLEDASDLHIEYTKIDQDTRMASMKVTSKETGKLLGEKILIYDNDGERIQ